MIAAAIATALVAFGAPLATARAVVPQIWLVSTWDYGQADADSSNARISADGRYAVFETDAQLATGDRNQKSDIYRRGLFAGGTTELVSVAVTGGSPGSGDSHTPAVSRDGRYVVFISLASGLTAKAPGPGTYVRDMASHTTTRVDVLSSGVHVEWGQSTSTNWWRPAISADGSRIAFVSGDPALGEVGSGRRQVFVRVRGTDTIFQASVAADGGAARLPCAFPSLNADGTRVAFLTASPLLSEIGYLPRVYLWDQALSRPTLVSEGVTNGAPSISGDGSKVAFTSAAVGLVDGVSSGSPNVFVRSMESSTTECASIDPGGSQGAGSYYPSMSGDGRYVAFQSDNAQGMTEHDSGALFVRRLGSDTLLRVGVDTTSAAGGSLVPGSGAFDSCTSISADGRYAVFDSSAVSLVAGGTHGGRDVFRCDLRPQVLASLSRPRLSPSSPYRNRYFYVTGTVTRHSVKSAVRLYFYRQVGKSWRYHKCVKVSTARSYKSRVRLPYKGRWYVRARHPADTGHLTSSSTYRTFTVR